MQCRYCFGDEDPETMITPCLCRGTSQFTHIVCLQRYFAYYPDHVCRVCNARMEYVSSLERVLPCIFIPVLTSLVMITDASPAAKCMLLLGGLGLSAMFATHSIFHKDLAIGSAIIGFILLLSRTNMQLTLWFLGVMGICMWFRTVLQYIQPVVLLVFLTCTIIAAYLVLIMMSIVHHLDALGTALFVMQVFLYWQSVLALRPGHDRNRIRNE